MPISKRQVAGGGHEDFLDHRLPSKEALSSLIPAAIGDPISIESIPLISSLDLISKMEMKGAIISEVSLPVYRAGAEGRPRKMDNSDCLRGYLPLYDDMAHFEEVLASVRASVESLKTLFSDDSIVSSIENQDLLKITQQRWRPPGWFVHQPFADEIKLDAYPMEFHRAMIAVCKRYRQAVPREISSLSDYDLLMLDFDPPDTNTGLPVMASGEHSHMGRILTLKALPSINKPAHSWLRDYSNLGSSLGMPENFIFSSILATRHGPTRKPIKLWVADGAGYTSQLESVGLYDRTRFVYPIPYPINFVLSPTYMVLKHARMNILGLWHDPINMDRYVAALNRQGKYPYSIDFSGMDTTMPPHLIKMICQTLISAGFSPWPLQLLQSLYETMGIVTPSYMATGYSSTVISGMISWLSGFKLTSEFDTIYGATVFLSAMESLYPGTIKKWESGNFVFAELGDDILFTFDQPVDVEAVATIAKDMAGASLKVLEDAMFLKRLMPITKEIPKISRPFSRLIQQTFFNEDAYEGEGGVRPDAIMRLALLARLESLPDHPRFSEAWPIVYPALSKLGFIRRATSSYQERLRRGIPSLDDGDEQEIQLFAVKELSYMTALIARAKYEPSAATLLDLFARLGVSPTEDPQTHVIRKLYWDSLSEKPTPKYVRELGEACTWLNPR